MKKMLLATFLLLPQYALAREYPLNPDRFPSIGLTYSGTSQEGDFVSAGGGSQDIEERYGELVFDTRLPLSNSFTLNLAIGAVATVTEGKDSPTIFADETDTSGALLRIGARYYFNK